MRERIIETATTFVDDVEQRHLLVLYNVLIQAGTRFENARTATNYHALEIARNNFEDEVDRLSDSWKER